jgi:hypothetical protein
MSLEPGSLDRNGFEYCEQQSDRNGGSPLQSHRIEPGGRLFVAKDVLFGLASGGDDICIG